VKINSQSFGASPKREDSALVNKADYEKVKEAVRFINSRKTNFQGMTGIL
jgi:hypothetical protein